MRYFALTGATAQGGPQTRSLAAWVRQHGSRLADLPSPSLSGIELWRVDAALLDPVADIVPIPGGIFSNVTGSACGGYRVVDSQLGAFHPATGPPAARPSSAARSARSGPATARRCRRSTRWSGRDPVGQRPPDVKPIELPPLLAKLDVEAVAEADIPLPSARPPVTDRPGPALLDDRLIARAYLGTKPGVGLRRGLAAAASGSAGRWDGPRRCRTRRSASRSSGRCWSCRPTAARSAGRPGPPGRASAWSQAAMRPEPVPGLPARPAEVGSTRGPLLRPLGVALALLAAAAAAGRGRPPDPGRPGRTARTGR